MHRFLVLISALFGRLRLRRRSPLHFIIIGALSLMIIAPIAIPNSRAFRSTAFATTILQADFTLDNVPINVSSPFLPDKFYTADPGEFTQAATSSTAQPSNEFNLIAVPFGTSPTMESLPVAQFGGAESYRTALYQYRTGQSAIQQTGPTSTIFGQQVVGQVSQVSVSLDGGTPKPTLIVEWVVEAGKRLWIVRVGKEMATSETLSTLAPFIASLSDMGISSSKLDNPTTIKLDSVSASAPPPDIPDAVDNLPFPSWWNGNCDYHNYPGSNTLGASYLGMPACGPIGTERQVQFFPGAWGELEWQCVELSMRYLYLRYGIHPYGANGSQVVGNYRSSYGGGLQVITNGYAYPAPVAGDVLSYGPRSSNGHTSVVASASVDGNGNGSITVIQQNVVGNGWKTLTVSHWHVSGSQYTISAWLHHP